MYYIATACRAQLVLDSGEVCSLQSALDVDFSAVYNALIRTWLVPIGELDQLADRPFSIREVPGSKPGFSILLVVYAPISVPIIGMPRSQDLFLLEWNPPPVAQEISGHAQEPRCAES